MVRVVWLRIHFFWTQLKIVIFVVINPDLLISLITVMTSGDNTLMIFILSSLK